MVSFFYNTTNHQMLATRQETFEGYPGSEMHSPNRHLQDNPSIQALWARRLASSLHAAYSVPFSRLSPSSAFTASDPCSAQVSLVPFHALPTKSVGHVVFTWS